MNNSNKPYLIDAVIGNSKFLASMGCTGRMYRLWWPNINYPQHVDCIRSGLNSGGSTTWFDEPLEGWSHEAQYVESTNILSVKAKSSTSLIEVTTTTFAVPDQDFIIRHYSFCNNGDNEFESTFIHYSSFHITESKLYNTTQFDDRLDALTHFRKQYFFSIGSANVCSSYQAGDSAWGSAQAGELNGTDITMSSDGILGWKLIVPSKSTVEITIYISAGTTQEEAAKVLSLARNHEYAHWFNLTRQYWHDFLAAAVPCPINNKEVRKLYERSLLTMKLMFDDQTGTVIAAPEFDEEFSRCGGYGYCWGRDAAFIAVAMDRSGLMGMSEKFYEWALSAQNKDGSWQQRHYHDGCLAPSWGLQIDEGASILWGMWRHYSVTRNNTFASKVWPTVQSGADFLMRHMDADTGLPLPTKDLWEERSAEHVYSSAAVFGGLMAAASFAEHHRDMELAETWRNAAEDIRINISARCWNDEKGSFYRGLKLQVDEATYWEASQLGLPVQVVKDAKGYKRYELYYDPVIDISLIGLSIPFEVFPIDDPRMEQTADTIEAMLTSPAVGGIKRYENDHYIGGNPWILTTLWLCQYRILQGGKDSSADLFRWVLNHQTELGHLPEQVDKATGETAWVVPLTWSHAMFVLAVHMLAEK